MQEVQQQNKTKIKVMNGITTQQVSLVNQGTDSCFTTRPPEKEKTYFSHSQFKKKIKKKAFFKEGLPRHLFFCSETDKCLLAAAFAK